MFWNSCIILVGIFFHIDYFAWWIIKKIGFWFSIVNKIIEQRRPRLGTNCYTNINDGMVIMLSIILSKTPNKSNEQLQC